MPLVERIKLPASNSEPRVALRKDKLRLTQLDALRGLAALAVFWSHAFRMFPEMPSGLRGIERTPLHFLFDGSAAVLLFFVLSGFVLNIRYVGRDQYVPQWAPAFIVRRAWRIYPAFLGAVIVAMMLRFFLFDSTAARVFSPWFYGQWAGPFPWFRLPRLLTLVAPDIQPDFVSSPLWSLVYEMRVSLLFPLIILGVNARRGIWRDSCMLLGTCAGCLFLARLDSFLYLPHFVLGAFCAKHFVAIRERLQRWPGWAKVVWIVGSICLYELSSLIALPAGVRQMEYILKLCAGVGSAGLILGAGSFGSVSSVLNRGLFQFLGRTSYSFYLLHIPFLLALAPPLYRATNSYLCVWTVALVISYGAALALYKLCELPGIRVGNICSTWLTAWLSGVRTSKPGLALRRSPQEVRISTAVPRNPA